MGGFLFNSFANYLITLNKYALVSSVVVAGSARPQRLAEQRPDDTRARVRSRSHLLPGVNIMKV